MKIFAQLFQDMGVPETLTTDGGRAYISGQFQDLLKQYQVEHRVSSVGFPHGNTRSEQGAIFFKLSNGFRLERYSHILIWC